MSRAVVTLGLSAPEPEETAPDPGGPISAPARSPRSGPGGVAASAFLHALVIAMVFELTTIVHAPSSPSSSVPLRPRVNAVFLPPASVLRQLGGVRPRPRPPETARKDRISIGPPAPARSPEPLVLHRDDDLTQFAKGTSAFEGAHALPSAPPAPPPRAAEAARGEVGGLLPTRTAALPAPGPILASLQRLAAGGGDAGPMGVPSGRGGQMGPLFFDPEGADFTAWIQHFTSEIYTNWIIPPAAEFGWSGEVDFEFVVDRAGTVSDVRLVRSSGIGAYDRAARNALLGSRLLPLPADFAPATVAMRVGFVYNHPTS